MVICAMTIAGATASAQPTILAASVIGSGGGAATSGGMILSGTVGQAVIGPTAGGSMNALQGFWYMIPIEQGPTSVPATPGGTLVESAYLQSWPNPFSHETQLQVRIPSNGPVSLKLYDALGREVRTLLEGEHEAGLVTVRVDGQTLESGSYTAQLIAGAARHAIKLVVVK
jgi:hypothetical protein